MRNGQSPPSEARSSWVSAVTNPKRLAALQAVNLLDSPPEYSFDRLTRLASELLEVPVALVSLVDDHRQFFKSIHGLPEPWATRRETPLTHSFCKHVVSTGDHLGVEDARSDPRVQDNLAIRDLHVVAYLGFPLTTSNGQVLGSFCAIDTVPRVWTTRQQGILQDLTACVITEIELREDVLRLNKLEAELRHAQKAAEQACKAKGEFLAHMSHEVRTPLAAMIGFTEMLLDRQLGDQERVDTIQSLRRNGLHLQEIVDDILDLSKIEAGKVEVELLPSDPCVLLRDVVDTLRSKATSSGVKIEVACRGNLPGKVEVDATKIRQILFNLGGNAIKFAKNGTVRFSLDQEPADRGRFWLRFEVQDTGIGMTADQLSRLFTPFFQAEPSTKRKYGGTGLGLSISHKLARAMGGELTAESHLGSGSRFSFRVPVRLVSIDSGKSQVQPTPNVVATSPRFTGTILLADDSEDIRRAMAHRLRGLGLSVEFAQDGEDAISKARNRAYDLILMDIQMPGVDGLEAIQVLKNCGSRTPIVALTANAFDEDRQRCLQAGCTEYLRKPLRLEELTRILKAFCRSEGVPAASTCPMEVSA